jgi:histidinol-phosphate aminotransferase
MVVLRTFSKAMALAGLRAGYLLGDPDLVREVNKAKLPYNINFFTEAVAAGVLRNRELLRPQVEAMRAQRERIERELSGLRGITVFPSAANFVLFRVDPAIGHVRLFDRLLSEHGILIRDVSKYPMLDGCLRVNAGTPEETGEFLTAMTGILGTKTP